MERTPITTEIYTADPSAHVISGKLYVFPSHDRDYETTSDDSGDQYDMVDYHVFEWDTLDQPARDLGCVLKLEDIPWASKQLWAPDAAWVNNTLYFYFPARDKQGIFRIGVATSKSPHGPYVPQPQPIEGSFSIDPCVFLDDDAAYMTFGGLWGGQLDKWSTGTFQATPVAREPYENAYCPQIARLRPDMLGFAEAPRDLVIVDEQGVPLKVGDEARRYFEGPWMHKYRDTYYFSYSTGTTHQIVYATSPTPYGPYTYRGAILPPVSGWTTHHSITEFEGRWWLFYHDASLSGGTDHKRCVKYAELHYAADGSILPIVP